MRASQPSEEDTTIERWIKKVYEFEVYYMPILFPFALNVMTGTCYTFCIIIFFVSLFFFLVFNLLKLHRQCVENKALRVILESAAYIASFFLLLNVWPSGTNPMPYNVYKAWGENDLFALIFALFYLIYFILLYSNLIFAFKIKKGKIILQYQPTLGNVMPPFELSMG